MNQSHGSPDVVEAYLDELTSRLHGSPSRVRRVVAESEDHLRDAIEASVAAGMSPGEAQAEALRDFGTAAYVARAMNRADWTRSRGVVIRDASETLLRIAAVGMIVVGISGVAARVLATLTSAQTVFGLPNGADVSAASCAHWLAVQPGATTCQQAGTLEAAGDQTTAMVLVGLLGVLLFVGVAVVRRRAPHAAVLPTILAPSIAATAFGAAALGLAALAASNAVILSTWGSGLWWTSATCSFMAATGCVMWAVRALHTSYTFRP